MKQTGGRRRAPLLLGSTQLASLPQRTQNRISSESVERGPLTSKHVAARPRNHIVNIMRFNITTCASSIVNVELLLMIVCAFFCGCSDAKICKSVDIRNIVDNFSALKNCTVVVGSVKVVLLETTKKEDFDNIVFPDLVEVTGYVMVYRVRGVTSLGQLFPNLAIIRGMELFLDYSLVIYDTPDLEEIGLYNLISIDRGSIRIEKSEKICYVTTINYAAFGNRSLHYFPTSGNSENCKYEECPKHCEGYCWNSKHCQIPKNNNCHPVCAACKGTGPNDCLGCKVLSDEGKCVTECPPDKYSHKSVCITKEACLATITSKEDKEKLFTFKRECLEECPLNYERVSAAEGNCKYCGDVCLKICEEVLVDTLDAVQKLRGCTHINGFLQIKIESKIDIKELEDNLGRIEEINDYLKVYRSPHIRNLNFLKNLKVIHGKELDRNRYSLVVHENQNLQKLWDLHNRTLKITNGTFSFHYNPQLCIPEIENLFVALGFPKNFSILDVSTLSNGDKLSCNNDPIDVTVVELESKRANITWKSFQVDNTTSELVGYGVYYIEAPGNKNISIYDSRDVCNDSGWNTKIVSNLNNTNTFINASISDLKPFTRYAYYVKTYISALNQYHSTAVRQAQSKMQYFITLSDDPSIPENVHAFPSGSNAIKLTWERPKYLNGELSHYVITGYLIMENHTFLGTRDFCKYPHKHNIPKEEYETTTESLKNTTAESRDCCDKVEENLNITKITLVDFDAICDNLEKKGKYGVASNRGCKNYAYRMVDSVWHEKHLDHDIEISKRGGGSLVKKDKPSQRIFIEELVDPTLTSYEIKNLQHFSIYVIFITACNKNRTQVQQCSSVVQVSQRTGKNQKADTVPDFYMKNKDVHNVQLSWIEPPSPNGMIVSYNVEYQNKYSENSKCQVTCITAKEFRENKSTYELGLTPGKYTVRIRANSLAGFGEYSEYKTIEVMMPSGSVPIGGLIAIFICMFVATAAVVIYFLYWRRKRQLLLLHLIPSINPDYNTHVYQEDEWEIPRSDVDLGKEIGQGSFGMVYTGLIKSQDRPCAVKTVNEHANIHERMEFLNEACVMKSFNDAHHVVRLLGVVSRGQPPLVVMELMARGDLKSFLRSCRDSSNCITCAEMYRMSSEIADGMAYLAAKKFVHRDLAARNCMVAADHTVKIGDFGMTRDIYETDYYRKESKGLLPVRWMAPESLADGVFTSDADVWSYGIVLWEMVTLAEQPYQGLANEQVLQYVIARGTLQRPPECPDLLYEIMQACWKWRPNSRPQFIDIVAKLENSVGQDFKLISFYHSREGEEFRMNHAHKRTYNAPAATILSPKDAIVQWRHNDDDDLSYHSEDDVDHPLSSNRDRTLHMSSSGLSHKYDPSPN